MIENKSENKSKILIFIFVIRTWKVPLYTNYKVIYYYIVY